MRLSQLSHEYNCAYRKREVFFRIAPFLQGHIRANCAYYCFVFLPYLRAKMQGQSVPKYWEVIATS
jgi:hypothetical protein